MPVKQHRCRRAEVVRRGQPLHRLDMRLCIPKCPACFQVLLTYFRPHVAGFSLGSSVNVRVMEVCTNMAKAMRLLSCNTDCAVPLRDATLRI